MNNFLRTVIESITSIYNNSMLQICDEQFRFRFAGQEFANLLGVNVTDIIDKKLSEIVCPIQHLAPRYYELNYPILNSNASQAHYLTYSIRNNQLLVVENRARPIMYQNKSIGLCIESNVATNISNVKIGTLLELHHEPIIIQNLSENQNSQTLLTEIEELIIFLVLIGKIDKEISMILQAIGINISREGVVKVIVRKIFAKLQVSTRKELITKIYHLGLNTQLPRLLISNLKLLKLI